MSNDSSRIRILPDSLVDIIAAGEVVERPASVVKELVENAIDAGAKAIRLMISDGGRGSIQVLDDGCGMDEENSLLAIERHATSKIYAVEDLRNIRTLGFRGEALPSIAAVGRLTLESWDGEAPNGTRIVVDNGKLLSVEPAGRARGTTVKLEGLFRKLPARRKFMRTSKTETAWCLRAVEDAALANPTISFTVKGEGAELLNMPPSFSLRDRVVSLWGLDTARKLMDLSYEGEKVSLKGLISPPTESYSQRSRPRIMVNGRPVRDPVLNRVISSALSGSWPAGRFPALVLSILVEDDLVDMNVHPAKREVRFRSTEPLADALRQAVKSVKVPVKVSIPYSVDDRSPDGDAVPAADRKLPFGQADIDQSLGAQSSPETVSETTLPGQGTIHGRILGQALGTYILLEGETGLDIIDQHAAHERIVFNRLMARRAGEKVPVQSLAVPLVLTMSPSEIANLLAASGLLESFGFEIDQFGLDAVRITALPADLKAELTEGLLRHLAADSESLSADPEDVALAVSRWACRQSVMAGRRLSKEEMIQLVDELDEAESGFSCPHGRPTRISLNSVDLEKLFRRR